MLSQPNPNLLRPIRSDEFLPSISPWTTFGGLSLVSAFGAAIALVSVSTYNVAVKSTATVRPAGEIQIVQATSEGTVKNIEVQENEAVKQGEVIAQIDNSQLGTKKSQLEENIRQKNAQLEQINAQIMAIDSQIEAELSLVKGLVTSAQAELRDKQRSYQEQLLKTQIELQEAESAFEIAKSQLVNYEYLAKEGVVSRMQLQEKHQAFIAAQAKLELAIAAQNPSTASVAIVAERISQEQAKGQSTQAILRKEREALIQRRIEIENQIHQDKKDLQQVAIELDKNVIRATTDGIILKLELRNPGQTVNSGQEIATIVPQDVPLIVKAKVDAQDIGKVEIGQKVEMKVSAYPYPDYGTLKGTVQVVAPDVTTSQSSDASYYEVQIQPEQLYLVKGERQYPIEAGMDITADIITRKERAIMFLVKKARLITGL